MVDYNSSNGMIVDVWGPPLWMSLHIMSFNFTPEKSKHYADFFASLQHVLPCGACRQNYPKNVKNARFNGSGAKWWPKFPKFDVKKPPRALQSREFCARFVYDLHNEVREMTGKPKHVLSFEETRDEYERYRAKGCSKPKTAKEAGCIKAASAVPMRCRMDVVPTRKIDVSAEPLGLHMRRRDGDIVVTKSSRDEVAVGSTLMCIDGEDVDWDGLKSAIHDCRGGNIRSFEFRVAPS